MLNINATVIIQLINFLIMVAVLSFLAYKPILKIMHERESQIINRISNAEHEYENAKNLKEEYFKQLQETKIQAQKILDQAKNQAKELKERFLDESREENLKLIKITKAELLRQKDKMLEDTRKEIIEIAIQCASKIINREINAKDEERFANEYIEQLTIENIGEKYVS